MTQRVNLSPISMLKLRKHLPDMVEKSSYQT
jgi:hypothetical protein